MEDANLNAVTNAFGVSRINAAGLINLTLENLWNEAFKVQAKNLLWQWNRKLDSLWLILGGDATEKSDTVKDFNKIEEQIGKTGSLIYTKKGFEKISGKDVTNLSLQYQLLMKKSLFLRRLQNQQGKGTAYADPNEDDFD